MTNIKSMSYEELVATKKEIEARMKTFKRVRLKVKWVRCGKEGCFCADGPLDNEWGNLHGPYIFAQFVDKGTRKTRRISLGRCSSDNERNDALLSAKIKWSDYFKVGQSQYDTYDEAYKRELWHITLSENDFKEHYGMYPYEDTMGRDRKFYGTQAQYEAYQSAKNERFEAVKAASDELAIKYGILSPTGQKILRSILADGYYIASFDDIPEVE